MSIINILNGHQIFQGIWDRVEYFDSQRPQNIYNCLAIQTTVACVHYALYITVCLRDFGLIDLPQIKPILDTIAQTEPFLFMSHNKHNTN